MEEKQPDPAGDPFMAIGPPPSSLGGAGEVPGSFGVAGRGPRLFGRGAGGAGRAPRLFSRDGRSGTIISTLSTLIVLGALAALFLLAPGSRQVRHAFFSPRDMWRSLIGNPRQGYYSVGAAIWLNIRMFLVAEVLILVLALMVALIRQSTHPAMFPVRVLGTVYVDFFRGVPLILVIFAIGLGIPALSLPVVSSQSDAIYGVSALVLSYSAYVSEVYRAGLNSVHQSQTMAARSLGLRHGTALRHVILPQAVRNIIPPLLNDFISLQKDTALVGVLGTIEANKAADIYSEQVFNFSSFTVAAIFFLILTIPLARFTDHLIDRDRRRRLAGGAA